MKLSEPYKKYDVEPLNSGAQQYTKEVYMYQVADPNADKGSPNIILWNRDKILEVEKKYFFKLVNFCKGKGIEFVVITTPVPQETLELHSQTFKKSHEYYKKMMEKHKIPFYDFNFINLNGCLLYTSQSFFGADERAAVYEVTSQSDRAKMIEDGTEKLKDAGNYKELSMTIQDIEVAVGDIVGGRERITGLYMKQPRCV